MAGSKTIIAVGMLGPVFRSGTDALNVGNDISGNDQVGIERGVVEAVGVWLWVMDDRFKLRPAWDILFLVQNVGSYV